MFEFQTPGYFPTNLFMRSDNSIQSINRKAAKSHEKYPFTFFHLSLIYY